MGAEQLVGLMDEAPGAAVAGAGTVQGAATSGLLTQASAVVKQGLSWGFVLLVFHLAASQGWLQWLIPQSPPPPPRHRQPRPDPTPSPARTATRGEADSAGPSPAAEAEPESGGAGDGMDSEHDEAAQRAAVDALLSRANQHRADMKHGKLGIDHLVLALAENPRFAEILQCADGLTQESVKAAIRKSRVLFNRGDPAEEELVPEVETALTRYARNLTSAAREGKLDPLVGRADEVRRVIHILCRRTKNNPVIVGEPGVGKTALVEGLAQRIAAGDVPEPLQGVQLMALDMGLLMAGAMMPGEFEERLKGVLKELTASGTKYVLFIDDLHNVTGPNAAQGGGVMDASVLLKPLLSRGELRCIGATSTDKFKKFIEKDVALERRFQQVVLAAPSVSDTVSILRGLRARLERHHAVRITDAALHAAATLSERHIPDRHLPDKALDLVDEAGSRVRVDMSLKPELLDRVERRVSALEAERRLLRRSAHRSKADALALEGVELELTSLRLQRNEMFDRYQAERSKAGAMVALQEEIDRLTDDIEAEEDSAAAAAAAPATTPSPAASAPDVAAVESAASKATRRTELVRQLRRLQEEWLAAGTRPAGGKASKGRGFVAPLAAVGEVTEADIARVISDWTGIPLTKLVETEVDKVLHLADELHRRIVGQHEAVSAVAEAIQRSRAGMKDPNGPIASFLFLGPTGVGKTELAKALAVSLFNAEEAMIRLDMSEFMEKHAVSKLIGAPPGYVGFDEGGQLTEKVRHRPYSVILFDEVEKAHVDVFNVLLQILDDGRVTDGQGRLVSFKNTLIIMTSNLGSQEVYRAGLTAGKVAGAPPAAVDKDKVKELVMEQVRKHFRPEFINRVDEFIIFEPLRADQMEHIVSLRIRGVVGRLAEKRIRLVLTQPALTYLATKGFDPVFGGRPVKRVIQREIETPLARALLGNEFREEDAVVVGLESSAGLQHLTFVRLPSGATPAGAAALDEELARQSAGPNGASVAAPADVEEASSNGGGGGAVTTDPTPPATGVQARSAPMKGMGARSLKFDPLKRVSEAVQGGADVSSDGWGARADPDSLAPNAN